jgi:predicted dehydrogenase
MKFAIVGCGAIADAHATAIRANEKTELVAGADPDEGARQKASEAWERPVFSSIDDMLSETEVDSAVVCAPPVFHRELTEKLLDAGIDVLCEKPLAPSLVDAKAMVEHAERSGRLLMVSSKFRYVDDLNEARKLIHEGKIGVPVYGEVTFCAPVPVAGRWPVQPSISGGGVVMDNACHAFDVLAAALDDPILSVGAAFGHRSVAPEVEDTAEVQFRTEGGTLGRLALSWTYFTKDLDFFLVQGTEGTLRVAWTGGVVRRHGDREWESFGKGYNKLGAFNGLIEDFVDQTRNGRRPDGIAHAIEAVELIENIYKAEESGYWQEVGKTPLAPL